MVNRGEQSPLSGQNAQNQDMDMQQEKNSIKQEGETLEQERSNEEETVETSSELEQNLALEAELKETKEKAEEYYAHLQRLQAEFDNYRRRTIKEKEELAKYASEQIIMDLLPVLDNFERAVAAAGESQDLQAYAQGVEMIFKQIQNVLEKEGLVAIESVGKPFDPNIHEAVLRVESEEYPENTVVEEMQKGYYLKEKVIRPSMVKVSC
ncbi:MAG: nucleotide exchange factor GrpE [Desulfitobacterium sp.]|nr:nucleotide exchange factor GrpE [Desulfitobacterium sp.]